MNRAEGDMKLDTVMKDIEKSNAIANELSSLIDSDN